MLVMLLSAAVAAKCPAPSFTFVGQPACVSLHFQGSETELVNRCEVPLLVDQSVLLAADPWVQPGAQVVLRDLSAFSLGLSGELFQVIAVMESCEAAPQ